jgi:predicted Rossmann fold nucleotide-binding protein DprA/Smf involved in DNA uptake
LPLGLAQFGKTLDAMQEALQAGHVLALSPYSPETAYSDALAEARLPLIVALSEAVFLVAPEHKPGDCPALHEARAAGKQVFIWTGAEGDATRAWVAAGAVPFADVAAVGELLARLWEQTPSASTQAASLVVSIAKDADAPSAFGGADEAIKALGSTGKVPDVLARRLRETRW